MKRGRYIVLVIGIILAIFTYGCVAEEKRIEQKIMENLIGEEVTYYNIAGQPIYYIISADDIKSIEKVETKEGTLWKVRVGKDLMWDFYFNKNGETIVKKEQLFVT